MVAALAALSGCAAPRPAESPRRVVVASDHVTLAEQDALIELGRGARVRVRLESQKMAVARRRWRITTADGAAVAPHGNPWFAAKHAHAALEPGNGIFDFDAVAPGRATVTFDYRRDDEPVSAAERTARFDFVVR